MYWLTLIQYETRSLLLSKPFVYFLITCNLFNNQATMDKSCVPGWHHVTTQFGTYHGVSAPHSTIFAKLSGLMNLLIPTVARRKTILVRVSSYKQLVIHWSCEFLPTNQHNCFSFKPSCLHFIKYLLAKLVVS